MMSSLKTSSPHVWIGYLKEPFDENALRHHFKNFGPIRKIETTKDKSGRVIGLVHYHNDEVAEVAAKEMNGKMICGKKIQTKGPKNLSPHTELTDCYYYILNGFCKPKQGQKCLYRHISQLRSTKIVCEKWANRSCTNRNCPKLHPSPKSETEASRKKPLERCKSHNAFKCYGDCGKENCNTHFQTEKDLEEHVLQKQKPLEKCAQCNAVFFDATEKLSHHHKESDKNKKATVESNAVVHKPKQSKAEPIGVFWDIENCQVPKGKSALAVVRKIRETFYPGRREVEFMCVCDTTKEKKEILEELNKSQINIIHINATSKNAADDKLKQSLRRFAQTHQPPATIVLISGDVNFASELSDLRHRHNFRVVLVHNQQASNALRQCANESHNFEQLTMGLSAIEVPAVAEDLSKEVVVLNLPAGNRQTSNKVRNQLKILSGNTGGKVISLQMSEDESNGSTAVLRFADTESAKKAVSRLNNEEVLGSKIKVKLKYQHKQTASQQAGGKENNVKTKHNQQFHSGGVNTNLKMGKSKSMLTLTNNIASSQNLNSNQVNNTKNRKLKSSTTGNGSGSLEVLNRNVNGNHQIGNHQMHMFNQRFQGSPSTLPLMAFNQMPPVLPHLPPLPLMQLNNPVHNLPQQSQKKTKSGSECLIMNLDPTVGIEELKIHLHALIREHCKFSSISFSSNKKKVQATVSFPRTQDASLCVAKLNNHKFFNQNIKVSLNLGKGNAALKMKTEAASLLQEATLKWLPLNEFLLIYKGRYSKALHVLDLDQIKDVIYVDGKPGNQFICLLHFNIGSLKVKQDGNFSKEISEILRQHNRKIPFTSLLGLYWSYTQKKIAFNESGEMLIKIVSNQDICFFGSSPENQVIFYKKPRPGKAQKFPLEDFEKDIVQLLRISPGFLIPFNKVASLYQQFFGRQLCVVDDYGYKELGDLLKALPEVIQVIEQKDSKNVSFTPTYKQILLNKTFTELVTGRDKPKILLSGLLTTYYRHYGHKLYYRNYGYPSFLDLISSLDRRFKIIGSGDGKMLALSPQKRKPSQKVLKKFAEEIASMIQSKPDKQLAFHNLSSEFYKHYKKQLKISDFGFAKLNDLVSAISDFVEIRGSRDQKILYMADDHPDFESLWIEVDQLVEMSREQCILGLQLPDIYQDYFEKSFPLDDVKINRFFKRPSRNSLVIGKGSHQIVVAHNKENLPSNLLWEHIALLTYYKFEHFKASIEMLCSMLSPENELQVTMERLHTEVAVCDYFEYIDNLVHLLPVKSHKLFEHDVIQILYDQPDYKLLMNHFAKAYTKQFKRVMKISDYGVNKLMHLFDKITKGFIKVEHPPNGGQSTVSLDRLGKLCMECDQMLNESNGALLLCNFAPEYQRKYGIQLRPNDYGFSKIFELVECFDCVFQVYGEKNMKVVVQRDKLLNPVVEVESIVAADSGSESDSDVIVESEELEVKDDVELQETDLLRFHSVDDGEEDYHQTNQNDCEWWMDPIPNLPEPALQPEQSFSEFDLISFKEFENDDIRSGGIDNNALPPPLIPNASLSSSDSSTRLRSKNSSDHFVDNLFSTDVLETPMQPQQQQHQEPDLMRMLVGRCSPVDQYFMKPPLTTNDYESSIFDSVSDTYSCSSAFDNQNKEESSYVSALNDLHLNSCNRTLRPKIAANFNKV